VDLVGAAAVEAKALVDERFVLLERFAVPRKHQVHVHLARETKGLEIGHERLRPVRRAVSRAREKRI
jgi:hypothetical protein